MGRAEDIFEKLKREGESAIDEFIATRQSEELYLDFKRSANDGSGKVLHENDRNNIAKAISGFGNSEGGVIVWGVDASTNVDGADVAKLKRPIENVARFVSLLEGSVSGRTVPPHPKILHHGIDCGNGEGFVATLIPQSNLAPHQSIPESKYYIRAGSNFIPVPHAVLSGMFGRRPQPKVFHTFSCPPAKIVEHSGQPKAIQISLTFQVTNDGPVIARDLFSNIKLMIPKSACKAAFEIPEPDNWTARMNLGVWLSEVTKEEFKLAPDSFTTPFKLTLEISPPFVSGLFWMRWSFGCEGAPINIIETEYTLTEVENMYQEFMAGPQTKKHRHEFVSKFFKFRLQN